MIGALITFAVLFGLIKVFEKDRDDLDNFNIAMVAIVPILIALLVGAGISMMIPEPGPLLYLPSVVLLVTTFVLLWKNLEIPINRAIGYTLAIVVVNELMGLALGTLGGG